MDLKTRKPITNYYLAVMHWASNEFALLCGVGRLAGKLKRNHQKRNNCRNHTGKYHMYIPCRPMENLSVTLELEPFVS